MESPVPASPAQPLLDRLTSPLAAGVVLLLFWLLLVASAWNKSVVIDEMVPPVAGIAHWKYQDYRIDPENGDLPHRLAALSLLGTKVPPMTLDSWKNPDPADFGDAWFNNSGNDVAGMLHRGRAVMALLAVALAAVVWRCSRSLFGPTGGMLSLILCVLNPTILANGPLMTADTGSALFFLAATWSWWRLLDRVTPGRLALSALAAGGLLVSKMSGPLILPIALFLAVARLMDGQPLEVSVWSWRREMKGRWRQAVAVTAAGTVQALIAYVIVWGFYGFRYEMMAPGLPSTRGSAVLWEPLLAPPSLPVAVEGLQLPGPTLLRVRNLLDSYPVPIDGWSDVSATALTELRRDVLTPEQADLLVRRLTEPASGGVVGLVQFFERHKVFPETFLMGTLHTVRGARMRWAFLNGENYRIGKPWFFPYTFAVKTPLPLLGLLALAAAAVWSGRRQHPPEWTQRIFYNCLPLFALIVVYGLIAVTSKLNIGHRHIMALYPPLFVMGGAAGVWIKSRPKRGPLREERDPTIPSNVPLLPTSLSELRRTGTQWATLLLVSLLTLETAWRFPNYIAYFNGVVSPSEGYLHLVDSSLDWGQDLPGVKKYLGNHPSEGPFYLAFFGMGDPRTYGIEGKFLPSMPGRFLADSRPVVTVPVPSPTLTPDGLNRLGNTYPGHAVIGAGMSVDGQSIAVLLRRPVSWRLTAGTFLISATLLQAQPWRESDESKYQALRQLTRPVVAPASADELGRALGSYSGTRQLGEQLADFENARTQRLFAFLRTHTPDATIGYSILGFKLTDADIARALEGPPPYSRTYLGRTLNPPR